MLCDTHLCLQTEQQLHAAHAHAMPCKSFVQGSGGRKCSIPFTYRFLNISSLIQTSVEPHRVMISSVGPFCFGTKDALWASK